VTKIRLLPVVVMAIAALLVLKTLGLVTSGGYVLTGIGAAQASGTSGGSEAGTTESDSTVTPVGEPTIEDSSPTLTDSAPTLGEEPAEAGGHGAPAAEADHGAAAAAEGDHGAPAAEATEEHGAPAADAAADDHAAPAEETAAADHGAAVDTNCVVSDAAITAGGEVVLNPASGAVSGDGGHGAPAADAGDHGAPGEEPVVPTPGSFAAEMTVDCLPSGDVVPMEISDQGEIVPLVGADGVSATEQQLLERLTARRTELQAYEEDLAMRESIVDAAEKRIEERTATLEALEAQISTLVDQREEMETGQFAGIVAMYETMKPKDAANIFNNLDMEVLLRVAKTMSPRKMAPILAEMDAARAQELTVQMAALADRPAAEMTPEDLAALPQIVGQ
jgi:flagellar motility protein MotE (MotC chaperone)